MSPGSYPQSSEPSHDLGLRQRRPYLLSIFFVLDGIHCAARLGVKHEVKAGVFTEATGIAEKGILLIIVDGPEEPQCSGQWEQRFGREKVSKRRDDSTCLP